MTMSLDVLYHLVDYNIWTTYLDNLFITSSNIVVIFASDIDVSPTARHVLFRRFTPYIEKHYKCWSIEPRISEPSSVVSSRTTAQFYIYRRKETCKTDIVYNIEDETCNPNDNPIKACSKENTIDVILTVWKRSTLQQQLSYVEYQSKKVSNVWVVQNENYINIDNIVKKYQTKSFKVHVIKFSKNSGYHGRFHIAYFMSQAEYVSIWDDDIIVYKKWLEYSIQESKAHNDALVGANGRNVISIQPFKQKGESREGSVGDFVGHTWTLKRSLLRHYFAETQLTYATGEDMQLSYALKKHGIISWTPAKQSDDRRAGDMPQSGDRYASFKKPKTNNVRRWLVCSLILKGFDFQRCLDCTIESAQDCIGKEDKILKTIQKGEIGYSP